MIRRAAAVACLAPSGCMTAPAPPPTVPPAGAAGPFASLPTVSIEPVPDGWWRLYDGPALDGLVERSLAANADLKVAFANLEAARGALRLAQAQRLPQTLIESGLTVDNTAAQPSASSNVPTTDHDVAATASWDADLFGRLRANALAARADAAASAAALDGVKVAVAADTVLAYVDLCGANQGARISAEIVAARGWTIACPVPPRLSAALPAGDGTALLLRRPDLREAERRLGAAAARVRMARADLYPRLNLGGAVGLLTGNFVTTAFPLLSWAFPNLGPARARLAQARGTESAALASWEAAVLRALREVATALAAMDAEARRNPALQGATREAQLYARRSAARVRLGDAAFLLQIDAERTRATAALQQAQSDLALAQVQVAAFRALDGGWRAAGDAVAAPLVNQRQE